MNKLNIGNSALSSSGPTIINFKNNNPKTIFSPKYSYMIYHNNVLDQLNIRLLRKTILKKEKEVLAQFEYTKDWGTGLGPDSMTSRADSFNLLKWRQFLPLKKIIREQHDIFLQHLGYPSEQNLYVQCWANVLREGQGMNQHAHWFSEYSYLSGHLSIQVEDTHTCYVNPITNEEYKSKNVDGKMTLFEGWIPHYTEKHYSGSNLERITIAFDIIPEVTYKEDIYEHKKDHWVLI